MNWVEVALLIFGVGAFAGSFLIKGRDKKETVRQQMDAAMVRDMIDKEMQDAKDRVAEVVDETLEYAVEKTERASERISNEKIMAISEYSDTVLADINKSHQEVMFLYDMLNDKHNNLKETIKNVDRTAKEAEEAANAAAKALAAKANSETSVSVMDKGEVQLSPKEELERAEREKAAKEKEYARRQMARLILPMQQDTSLYRQIDTVPVNNMKTIPNKQDSELRPLVVKSVEIVSADIVNSKDMQPVRENKNVSPVSAVDLQTLGARPENMKVVDVKPADIRPVEVYSFVEQAPHIERPVNTVNTVSTESSNAQENNNDRILRMHKEGVSNVDIAKELGLGVGEVKLVINLFKGAV